jgi:hypothetical protein
MKDEIQSGRVRSAASISGNSAGKLTEIYELIFPDISRSRNSLLVDLPAN